MSDEQVRRGSRRKDPILTQLRTSGRGRAIEELSDLAVDHVGVTRAAAEKFIEVHGGGRRDAEEGVRDTLEDLIEEGHLEMDRRGYWQIFADGYRLVLSPDRDAVVGYATLHRERTLSEVRDGVKSKLRGNPVPAKKLKETLTPEWVDEIVIPGKLVASVRRQDEEFEETMDEIRDAIEDAAAAGAHTSEEGRHRLNVEEWSVWLRADAKRVVKVARHKSE